MSDKMREEFEAAVKLAFHQAGNVADLTKVRDQYVEDVHQSAWWGWKASRESLAIGLPEKCEFAEPGGDYHKGYRQGVRAMVEIAEAAGLKVKK